MEAKKPDLSIVMVLYNVVDLTRNSLRNIYENTNDISYEIICIDNNSLDTTVKMVQSEFPEVWLIVNKVNKGIAFANNQGIRESRGRYIALYNPDTLTIGNAFGEMVKYLDDHNEIAALGPQLLNEDGTIQVSARNGYINLWNEFSFHSGLYRFLSKIALFSNYQIGMKDIDTIQEVDQLITACLIIRAKELRKVNGMDETFFLYGDDVDLNKRLKDNGLRVLHYPKEKIYHLKGRSSKQFRKEVHQSMLNGHNYFIKKHYGIHKAFVHRLVIGIIGLSWMTIWIMVKLFYKPKRSHIEENQEIDKFKNMLLWGLNLVR